MSVIVQKFGGSSVSDAESIKRVARRIVETRRAGNDVCVIVSAMGDTTDELLDLAKQVTSEPPGRELDMLLTSGERISMALLAMAIATQDATARSFTGSQAGVITDDAHGQARIIDVTPGRITEALANGHIAIVAGFQGVSQNSKDVTTLGRGGSDTTAVALAAALHADVCEIYTDVDGVFTADPRILPAARKLATLSSEEMLDLAASGSKILHLRCVEYARRYGIPIHVRSSWSSLPGTWILENPYGPNGTIPAGINLDGVDMLEAPIITGIAHDKSESKLTIVGVPDKPGLAAAIFGVIAEAGLNIDMIVQNVSASATGVTDISFTLPKEDGPTGLTALQRIQNELGLGQILFDDQVGKISVVGAGMKSNPGVSAKVFRALADAGVNVEMISTSEIRISVVVREDDVDAAVRALHTSFGLDSTQGEAIVYGGTGR